MEIIYVFNGLGNQMSQYALYLHKKTRGQHVKCVFKDTAHNGIELGRLFGIYTPHSNLDKLYDCLYYLFAMTKRNLLLLLTRRFIRLFHINVEIERGNYSFNPDILEEKKGLCIYNGGWHHYQYFSGIETVIRETYQFPAILDEKNLSILEAARQHCHIAVHIRGGDYFNAGTYEKIGSICTEQYYHNCFQRTEADIDAPVYYVFTNDREWAEYLLRGRFYIIIDWNNGLDSWKDMVLMSSFHRLIIANSTFSWWAAWLGKCEMVLCPEVFVKGDPQSDIYLPEWVKIAS